MVVVERNSNNELKSSSPRLLAVAEASDCDCDCDCGGVAIILLLLLLFHLGRPRRMMIMMVLYISPNRSGVFGISIDNYWKHDHSPRPLEFFPSVQASRPAKQSLWIGRVPDKSIIVELVLLINPFKQLSTLACKVHRLSCWLHACWRGGPICDMVIFMSFSFTGCTT